MLALSPAPWPANGWQHLMAEDVGDAKAHRRSIRTSLLHCRCLEEAAGLGHFRAHPFEHNLMAERATGCRQFMGQDPGEQAAKDGGLLLRDALEIPGIQTPGTPSRPSSPMS
jgi:hypothetical protein